MLDDGSAEPYGVSTDRTHRGRRTMAEDTRTTTAPVSAGLLTPASRAIAGLALAVGGLLGQNVISGGPPARPHR